MKKRQTVSAAVLFTLGYLTLAPQARAVCQDACLPSANTAQGDNALISLTSGGYNTAIGFEALISNTSGSSNTAIGYLALWYNTIGNDNTANGEGALGFNTTGSSNAANGEGALGFNTTGNSNTAPITTPPRVFTHSLATGRARTTRPPVLRRSLAM